MQDPETGELKRLWDMQEAREKTAEGFCVLQIGEEVTLKGGRFRIVAMGRRYVYLEGLPGTKLPPE